MKIVEVPFFWDGVKNIKDREELKEGFAKVFAEKDLTQLEYTIKEIHAFAKGVEKFREKDQKLLKEIMSRDDRIVLVALKRDGVAVVVRIREGNGLSRLAGGAILQSESDGRFLLNSRVHHACHYA